MEKETPDAVDEADRRDDRSARDQMFAALYADLRRLADRALHNNVAGGVSPTTLVHEVYLDFSARSTLSIEDRARFLAYAARAMRSVLIDLFRRGQALKRGLGFQITHLNTEIGDEIPDLEEFSRLSEALDALAMGEPRLAEVVDLRYFCGFSFAEIAALRATSERTVQRDWEKARLILFRDLGPES